MKNYGVVSLLSVALITACVSTSTSSSAFDPLEQDPNGRPPTDLSKPVPAKSEVIKAWQKRQDMIKTFRFAWTEQQTHPKGWLPNPRYPEREWLNIPGLLIDRSYTVSKTLAVDGNKMRYSFEIDRKEEADTGGNNGLGVRRHYSYISVFDGQAGKIRITSLSSSTPPATIQVPECRRAEPGHQSDPDDISPP